MAVLARDEVTLASITDVQYMRRYYLLQLSNLAAPAVPTTNPPGGSWGTTEPTYTEGSTNSLYVTDLVVFSDGTFDYLPVQRSSSYEAAKVAYNKAVAAQSAADSATNQIELIRSTGANIVVDGGFENATLRNGTSTEQAKSGLRSLKVTANGAIQDIPLATINATPGRVFYGEVWIRCGDATAHSGTVNLAATCANTAATPNTYTWPAFSTSALVAGATSADGWVKYSGTVTMPAGYDQITFRLSVRQEVPAGRVYYFDDVFITDGTEATTALISANGSNAIIKSTSAASGTTHPTTGAALKTGDWWEQWDNDTNRNVVGLWRWSGSAWQAQTIAHQVISSMDVNKLVVTGAARITFAVMDKLMADAAFHNVLTTDKLYAGAGSIDSLVAQQFATALASIIEARIENLTVTAGANIDSAVIQKIATELIEGQVFRTEIDPGTGLYAIMDSFGFRVIDNGDVSGVVRTLVSLGPSGVNLLQLGDGGNQVTIDSGGGVSGRSGSFEEIYLDGTPIQDALTNDARGVISYGRLAKGNYSVQRQARGQVLGLEASLPRGRLYRLRTTPAVCGTQNGNVVPMLRMHYTLNGDYPGDNWTGTQYGESMIGPYAGWRALPGMETKIDLRGENPSDPPRFLRASLSLGDDANQGWAQISTVVGECGMEVEDLGTKPVNRGLPYYVSGATPPPTQTRQTHRIHPTAWATYFRAGTTSGPARDTSATGPIQGRSEGSSYHRDCIFVFPSLTTLLAGATIHRITLHAFADHWYYGSGGTATWCWHGETGVPSTAPVQTFMRDETGWPRGAAREAHIVSSEFGAWQNGTRKGFGFATPVTAATHYGRFSSNLSAHWIELEFTK